MTTDRIWYGGDYNPEQWPSDVWDEDVRLMQRAGVTVATVGVFSWAKLEPRDGYFAFDWLDDVLGRLHAGGIGVDLATATASPPPWLTTAHPDVLPVTADGVTLSVGSRQQYSPSSATYRRYADRLVRAIAERYRDHPALVAWHVNNELACHVPYDHSDESAKAFRTWLQDRYGDLDTLNEAWGTSFWSQAYSDWQEVVPPRAAPTFLNPTQLLDWDRFSSDAWLGVLRAEAAILREVSPGVPVTTNFMGLYKPSDYWAWAREVDFVSDDHYVDPAEPDAHVRAALTRDLMRSLGAGKPWILMEQATSAVNWRPQNAVVPAGWHRTLSLQAVARGADGVMQFQWRQSRAGAEKFHSAMVPHAGTDTRVFRETVELGADLADLADVVGTTLTADVAIVLDWDSWWAIEQQATPAQLDYAAIVRRWYTVLWRRGVLVDFVSPSGDLGGYRVVVAPAVQVLPAAAQQNLASFVDDGGELVVGYQTGILDERLRAVLDGYLGALQRVLGVHVEEFAPAAAPAGGTLPAFRIDGLAGGEATEWGEVVRVHDAEVLSTFAGGFLDGLPAITRRPGAAGGSAWYVATAPSDLDTLVKAVLEHAAVSVPWPPLPEGTERVRRGPVEFLLNHTARAVTVDGVTVDPFNAMVRRHGSSPSTSAPTGSPWSPKPHSCGSPEGA
ncbi:beta-galactosidase [Curtobacterium sp. PhB136]|uniref:beta-galactosidase n=1 Tax=Curtobacterium sp. PhB136 TaxID=2485181 RepID=UPI0010E26E4F|nr:beta-galactosidase [Curtobacterium sp. PhB136]TCK59248.1 beta-galactosidase [Curtobacterium sp. PhB136]